MHTKFIVFFSRSTILQILKWNWRTAQKIIWLTPYFNKGVIQGREDPPSATKNLETSDCGDGWKVRTDSKQQPFSFTSPPGVQGTGGIHAGGTHCADVGPRGLHKQQLLLSNERGREQLYRVHQPMPMLLVRGSGEKSGSGRICQYKKWMSIYTILLLGRKGIFHKLVYVLPPTWLILCVCITLWDELIELIVS